MSFLLDSAAAIIAGVFMGLIVAYFYVKWQNARLFHNKARILAKLGENKFIMDGKQYDLEKELKENEKPKKGVKKNETKS